MLSASMTKAERNGVVALLSNRVMKKSGPKKPPMSMKVLYIPIPPALSLEGTISDNSTIAEVILMPRLKPSKSPKSKNISKEERIVYA